MFVIFAHLPEMTNFTSEASGTSNVIVVVGLNGLG